MNAEGSTRAPHAAVLASAPMRVSFAGGGSDMPPFTRGVGGRVIGSAIDVRVRATAEPFDAGWVKLELGDRSVTRRSTDLARADITFRLIEAVMAFTRVGDAVRVRIETDIAPGAGLGGSGAAAVATLAALLGSVGESLEPEELAATALRIERDDLGLACGPQDPLFAAFGGLLDLGFDEKGACVRRDAIATPAALVHEIERGMMLVDTMLRRVSGEVLGRAGGPMACASNSGLVEAADRMAAGFASGSLDEVIDAMKASAEAKGRRDPLANAGAAALAKRLEPLGARVVRACGAGAGGHILVWAPPDRHAAIERELRDGIVRRPALRAPGVAISL